nr:hypothetical protein [Tanacetum cinerariifolium]
MGHSSAHGSAHGSAPVNADEEDDYLVEEVSPVKPKNPSRCAARAKKNDPKEPPKEWTVEKEIALCQAWCDVSENNVVRNKYKMIYKQDFTLEHCYTILKDHQGWLDIKMPTFYNTKGRKKSKTSKTTSGLASDGFNLNNEVDEPMEETQEERPMGRD